jgi:hypothetical protein
MYSLFHPYKFKNWLFIKCVRILRFTVLECVEPTGRFHTICGYTTHFVQALYPYQFIPGLHANQMGGACTYALMFDSFGAYSAILYESHTDILSKIRGICNSNDEQVYKAVTAAWTGDCNRRCRHSFLWLTLLLKLSQWKRLSLSLFMMSTATISCSSKVQNINPHVLPLAALSAWVLWADCLSKRTCALYWRIHSRVLLEVMPSSPHSGPDLATDCVPPLWQ